MSNVLLSSRAGRGGIGTRRNHNYQAMYGPEPKGQEAGENARVWSVYLDEADDYDSDMINSFRTILDSLLVFASLFSAVVTTFAAQTSQVFQPNSAQISALLLIENNQLLRAAGNTTRIGSVPTSSLSPHGTTYTSIDLWVNGLFFVSLTLSLTTALLTVLAKQWIQTYVGVVPGNAKTQARVRQFRFDGLVKWKLGTIIESLPLILHSAVAAFLVGLALYVSQISGHICTIISLITALTFLFYLATSIIPTFSIDCPYRISSIFSLVQFLILIASSVRYWCHNVITKAVASWTNLSIHLHQPRIPQLVSLKKQVSLRTNSDYEVWKCLSWLFAHSTDNITKEIVVEGVSGMLHDLESSVLGNQVLHRPVVASLLLDVLVHSVNCQSELEESSDCDNPVDSTWNGAITAILSKPPDCLPLTLPRDLSSLEWRNFEIGVWKLYTTAFRENNQPYVESCVCLMKRFGMGQTIGGYLSKNGNDDDIRFAMDKRIKDLFFPPETTPFDSNMETSYPLGILLGRSHHQIEHNGPETRRDDHWAANVYQSEPLPNTVMYLPLTPNTNKETSVEVEFGEQDDAIQIREGR
ncbi:hypothetical protein H0H93_014921 [Arthromyces matolae]|nr:hypothetical protein H0H93_014921 [Arthromyces matolae]